MHYRQQNTLTRVVELEPREVARRSLLAGVSGWRRQTGRINLVAAAATPGDSARTVLFHLRSSSLRVCHPETDGRPIIERVATARTDGD